MTPRRAHAAGPGDLRMLGISHRSAAIAELERMALSPAATAALAARLHDSGVHAVVLSTCSRTELYTAALAPGDHARAAALLRDAAGGVLPSSGGFVTLHGAPAAAHLFRVAAGLESLLVGETEVLGQVRDALATAARAGSAGPFLERLFRAALRFGRRVRRDTGIGAGALSLASSAVRLLRGVHRDPAACTVLVVGTGATGLQVARHLAAEGVGRLWLANRTPARALEAAARMGGEALPLAAVPARLAEADAVIVAAHGDRPAISAAALGAARDGRSRPLVLIDLSLPRAIDPACAALPCVTLHDLTALETIVAGNRAGREREIPRVLELLEGDLARFLAAAIPPWPLPARGAALRGHAARRAQA